MGFLSFLEVLNYALVLIFGLFLSTHIAGGWKNPKQKQILFALSPALLLIQGICWLIWGVEVVRQIYPLIVHLPLVLSLVYVLKARVGEALVSVLAAYLCCQLPRWVTLTVAAISNSDLLGEICYTLAIGPIFLLLRRYFAPAAHEAMTYSLRMLLLFGCLPFVYYLFDYATAVYSDSLYTTSPALVEFIPTALAVFYVIFLTAYHSQNQNYTQAELQKNMLEAELKQSGLEIETLRNSKAQIAIYQHDMRHHLNVIDGFLSAGKPQQAAEYIQSVRADIEAITPKRFCDNELVNLLCSSFSERSERLGIRLSISAKLPQSLSISDTELCSLISNGLENALDSVSELPETLKWVEFYCEIKLGKLLFEIKNPYWGEIAMVNDLPVSAREGHGYGCRSIRSITQRYRGLCSFSPENGLFVLRVVIPI